MFIQATLIFNFVLIVKLRQILLAIGIIVIMVGSLFYVFNVKTYHYDLEHVFQRSSGVGIHQNLEVGDFVYGSWDVPVPGVVFAIIDPFGKIIYRIEENSGNFNFMSGGGEYIFFFSSPSEMRTLNASSINRSLAFSGYIAQILGSLEISIISMAIIITIVVGMVFFVIGLVAYIVKREPKALPRRI
jgi:hypothetical protein